MMIQVLPDLAAHPGHYIRDPDDPWHMEAGDRDSLVSPTDGIEVNIEGGGYILEDVLTLDLTETATWDQVATDYRVAANRAGLDFYIYACAPSSGRTPDILISHNSTYPTGYPTGARKVGGFHCIPATIQGLSSHPFEAHTIGDIHCGDDLSGSIWDLLHKPRGIAAPEGMTFSEETNLWAMIYHGSGTGVNFASVNGGTILDTVDWNAAVEYAGGVGMSLMRDEEFQLIAKGCPEEVNIAGSADPGVAGLYLTTDGKSNITDCGAIGLVGEMYTWLRTQSFRIDGLTDPTVDPEFSWHNLAGTVGSYYGQGTNQGDVKLLAGGDWRYGSICGSRCRYAYDARWNAHSYVGVRAVAEAA
jgi:hypothetical protein